MTYHFPFSIQDVCGLIDLTYRYQAGDSIYVDCPACSVFRKGKLNINCTKEQFRCNRCDVSGGMLDLYILFGHGHLTRSEARAEILTKLRSGNYSSGPVRSVNRFYIKPADSAERAHFKDIDFTYRALLSLLSLSDNHVDNLTRRGLTTEQIRSFGFCSVPDGACNEYITQELIRRGCTLRGVPGFYDFRRITRASGADMEIYMRFR